MSEDAESIISRVREWRQAGAQLRTALLDERKAVAQRLAELDRALAQLPPDDGPKLVISLDAQPSDVLVTRLRAQQATIADIVIEFLRASGAVPSPAIKAFVDRVRAKETEANTLFTTLGRLKRDGKIVVSGTRGAQTYSLS